MNNQQQPAGPQPGGQQQQQVPDPNANRANPANLDVPARQQQQLLERFRGKGDIYSYMVDIMVSQPPPTNLSAALLSAEKTAVPPRVFSPDHPE